jgi:hypothetical protein
MSDHVIDRLSAFLDEELPAREHEAVEGHLRGCSACSSRLALLRAVDTEARALPVSAPPGYFDTLPARIRGRLEKPARRTMPRLPVWSWAAAAALLLAAVTPLTLRRAPMLAPAPVATYPRDAAAQTEADKPAGALSPPAAGEDRRVPEVGAKDEAPTAKLQLDAPMRDQATGRRDRPAAGAAPYVPPPAAPPAAAPAEEPKIQESITVEAQPPARAPAAPRLRKAEPGGPYAQQQAPVQSQSAPAFAGAPVEAPAAPAADARAAASNEAAREESPAKRDGEAPREKAVGGAAAGRVASAVSSSDEKVFRLLQEAAPPTTLAALRERREAWRSFTRDFPGSPRADEARLRVVETGVEAWRTGGDAADLARVREDAAAYLARRDAVQAARVRALLEKLPQTP